MNVKTPVLILALSSLSFAVAAAENQTTNCQNGDLARTIELAYPAEGDLPCEVRYTKQGSTQILWSASNELGYCEMKAAEFVEKHRGWGWDCSAEPMVAPGADGTAQ